MVTLVIFSSSLDDAGEGLSLSPFSRRGFLEQGRIECRFPTIFWSRKVIPSLFLLRGGGAPDRTAADFLF